jgi:transcriptional regulator with XRE-family HTH domain
VTFELRRTTLGACLSEGARQLRIIKRRKGLSELAMARLLGLRTNSHVHKWLFCDVRPSRTHAVTIERELGIPVAAWSEAPRKPITIAHAA